MYSPSWPFLWHMHNHAESLIYMSSEVEMKTYKLGFYLN